MSSTVSVSESMAAMDITRISRKSCNVPLLGLRGSSISLRQPIRHTPFVAVISVAQKTRVDAILQGFTRWMHKLVNVNDYSSRVMSNAIMRAECGSPAIQGGNTCCLIG